jgi:uncharacterized protein with HEPN domain
MDDSVKKYLIDIQTAIRTIDLFIGESRNFFDYQNNLMLKRATEREFEIIGEALNKMLKLENSPEIKNHKQIISLRNYIIHAYDSINDATIWGIITNHLPLLKTEISNLLENSEKKL